MAYLSFLCVIGSLVLLRLDMNKRNKLEKTDGMDRKSLALIGMLAGFTIGAVIEFSLWRVITNSFKCIGIFMLLGVLLGSRINALIGGENWGKYKRIRRYIVLVAILALLVSVVIIYIKIIPFKDSIDIRNVPESKFVYDENNYFAYQSGNDCAGYSAAYILRNEGIEAEGKEIYESMDTFFGRVAVHNIVDYFKTRNINARFYHGNIETIKARINEGKPVIALVTITLGMHKGLHYIVVVGYDSEYLYVADSTQPKANVFDKQQYNRKLTYAEFEELWKTNVYPVNNIYIVVE